MLRSGSCNCNNVAYVGGFEVLFTPGSVLGVPLVLYILLPHCRCMRWVLCVTSVSLVRRSALKPTNEITWLGHRWPGWQTTPALRMKRVVLA